MPFELSFTSVPQGLRPGSRGYCTVARTAGMPADLAALLEQLSTYVPHFPAGHPQAGANPEVRSCLGVRFRDANWRIVSHIREIAADYSGRSNYLCRHLALAPEEWERQAGGPGALLLEPGKFAADWDGRVAELPPPLLPHVAEFAPGPCRAWQAAVGDAGHAGLLMEALAARRPTTLLFAPGQDVAALLREAIALLAPEQARQATFSTYAAAGLPPGAECLVRCFAVGSPAAEAAWRNAQALRLDVSRTLPPAAESPYVLAARRGERLAPQAPQGAFDAYYRCLGIPPAEQPPHHYRLLGLALFESDPEIIAGGADRQMAHLKTLAAGPRAEAIRNLLNELSAARLCLLQAERKSQYDHALRQRLMPQPQPVAVAAVVPTAVLAPAARLDLPSFPPPAMEPVPAAEPLDESLDGASAFPLGRLVGLVAAALVLATTVGWIAFGRRAAAEPEVAETIPVRPRAAPPVAAPSADAWRAGQTLAVSFDADERTVVGEKIKFEGGLPGREARGQMLQFVRERWGDAVEFREPGGRLDFPNSPDLNPGPAMSLAVRLRVERWEPNHWEACVVAKDQLTSAGKPVGYSLRCGNGTLCWRYASGGQTRDLLAAGLPLDTWLQVVCTYGPTGARLYVDGELRGTGPALGPLASSTVPLRVGADAESGDRPFTGRIDELALWNRTLTDAEVRTLHALGVAGESCCRAPGRPAPPSTVVPGRPASVPTTVAATSTPSTTTATTATATVPTTVPAAVAEPMVLPPAEVLSRRDFSAEIALERDAAGPGWTRDGRDLVSASRGDSLLNLPEEFPVDFRLRFEAVSEESDKVPFLMIGFRVGQERYGMSLVLQGRDEHRIWTGIDNFAGKRWYENTSSWGGILFASGTPTEVVLEGRSRTATLWVGGKRILQWQDGFHTIPNGHNPLFFRTLPHTRFDLPFLLAYSGRLRIRNLTLETLRPLPEVPLPIPPEPQRSEALARIDAKYAKGIARQDDPEAPWGVYSQLLWEAVDLPENSPDRYAAFLRLTEWSERSYVVGHRWTAAKEMGRYAGYDAAELRAKVLRDSSPKPHGWGENQAGKAIVWALAAIREERFRAADEWLEIAEQKGIDAEWPYRYPQLLRAWKARLRRCRAAVAALGDVRARVETDPAARTAVGKYYVTIHEDFDRGLPLLADGEPGPWREAALAERSAALIPTGSAPPVEPGPLWDKLAASLPPEDREAVLHRAARWHRGSLPRLDPVRRLATLKALERMGAAALPQYVRDRVFVHRGKRLQFNNFRMTWPEANDWAAMYGGKLVCIRDAEENALVLNMLRLSKLVDPKTGSAWIGATNDRRPGAWRWVDGTPFDYTNWDANEPNDTNAHESFAEMYLRPPGAPDLGRWNDRGEHKTHSFMQWPETAEAEK